MTRSRRFKEPDSPPPESGDGPFKTLASLGAALLIALLALAAVALILELTLIQTHRRPPPYESRATGALRTLVTAQSIFREDDRDRDGVFQYGDLADLREAGLVSEALARGQISGYRFTVAAGGDQDPMGEFVWWAAAEPIEPGETGDRYFFTNQSGVIWYSNKGPIEPIPGSPTRDPLDARKLGGP